MATIDNPIKGKVHLEDVDRLFAILGLPHDEVEKLTVLRDGDDFYAEVETRNGVRARRLVVVEHPPCASCSHDRHVHGLVDVMACSQRVERTGSDDECHCGGYVAIANGVPA